MEGCHLLDDTSDQWLILRVGEATQAKVYTRSVSVFPPLGFLSRFTEPLGPHNGDGRQDPPLSSPVPFSKEIISVGLVSTF